MACAGPPTATDVALVNNPNPSVPLAGVVSLEIADQEHRETVTPSSTARTDHEIPVLGLRPDREHTVTVTLRDANDQLRTVPRAEVQTIDSSGLSLMPEELEAGVHLQGMADLLAHLRSAR